MKKIADLNRKVNHAVRTVFVITFVLGLGACASTPEMPEEMRKPIDATDCSRDQCIDFIYLHGSRPAKMGTYAEEQAAFNEQTTELHNWISAELYANPEAQKGLLKNNSLKINPKPVQFYWGNMSKAEFDVVQRMLQWSQSEKGESGSLTKLAQKLFITGLHDTYWIGKFRNTRKVNLAIHDVVTQSFNNGRKVVLFGHSAGGLAIQTYAMYHWRYIDLQKLANSSKDDEAKEFLKDVSINTCIRALLESGTMEIAADGHVTSRLKNDTIPDMDAFHSFRRALWTEKLKILPEYTEKYCIPSGELLGFVTYGNPAPVLEATISDEQGGMLLRTIRHILENNYFWLNINHVDDPLGYSVYDGHELPERVEKLLKQKITPKGGFFVSGVDDTYVSVATAHSWYWLYPHEFAKALARIYAEGYQHRYYEDE